MYGIKKETFTQKILFQPQIDVYYWMFVRLLSSEINSEFDIKKAKSKYISILHFYVCRL